MCWLVLGVGLGGMVKRKEVEREVVKFLMLGKGVWVDIVWCGGNVRVSAF